MNADEYVVRAVNTLANGSHAFTVVDSAGRLVTVAIPHRRSDAGAVGETIRRALASRKVPPPVILPADA